MKYYERTYIGIDYQGPHGKKVYVPTKEYVKTNDIKPFNFKKQYKFEESKEAKKYLLHKEVNQVYIEHEQLSSSEVYFRKSISKRW